MKITLTYVSNEEKVSQNNKKYTACSIRCAEFKNPEDPTKEVWINGFGNSETKTWNTGDTVDVEIYDEEYQGKTYKKFKTLDKTDVVIEKMNQLNERLVKVEEYCFGGVAIYTPTAPVPTEVPGNPNATEEQKEEHAEKRPGLNF